MEYLAGIDIGGTKCAVTIGKIQDDKVELLWKEKIFISPVFRKMRLWF